jgi:hypothetical protein
MFLLAQAEPLTTDWADLLLKQGPLSVVFVLFVGFLIWYGRRIAEGHIDLVTVLKENAVKSDSYQARTTVTLEKISDTQRDLTETQREIVSQAKDFKCRHP